MNNNFNDLSTVSEKLETEYGVRIFAMLTGSEPRNKKPIRLFDDSKHTSEVFYDTGKYGKPNIHDFKTGDTYFAVSAFRKANALDWKESVISLGKDFGLLPTTYIPDVWHKNGYTPKKVITEKERTVGAYRIANPQFCEFSDTHLHFWAKYGISMAYLQGSQVRPLQSFDLVHTETGEARTILLKLAFAFGLSNGCWKIYQPESKYKWGWCIEPEATKPKEVLYGLDNLPAHCGTLLIVEGLKDCLAVNANLNNSEVYAVGLDSASVEISEASLAKLKSLSPRVMLCLDNDKTGKEQNKVKSQKYDLPCLYYAGKVMDCKDFADVCETHPKNIILDWVLKKVTLPDLPAPAPCDFPIHIFPPLLQNFITEYAEMRGLDKNCLAMCVLGTFSASVGLNYALTYSNGYTYHASMYGVMVGNSAVGKSDTLKLAYAPLVDIEKEWFDDYKADMSSWKKKNSAKGGTEEEPPTRKRVTIDDTTFESVIKIMQENQKGIGLFSDEIASWLTSFNKYRNGAGGDSKKWLEVWSNNRISKDRVSGSFFVPKSYCTIVGGIQPTEMHELVKGSFANDGFFFRFLFSFAQKDDELKTWEVLKEKASRQVDGRLYTTYQQAVKQYASEPQTDTPKTYQLDSAEEAYWAKHWFNPYQAERHSISAHNPALESVLTKLSIYCSRFQLLLQLIHEAYGADCTGFVAMDAVRGAIDLANSFKENFKVAMQMANTAESEAQPAFASSKAESVNWRTLFGDDTQLQRKEIVERIITLYGASERSAIRWISSSLKKCTDYGYWTYL